ncbi:complement C1q-like protein 2 [Argopecten irradians]|uniref:complement C1q-like protein 2 n=1 Tax=Argopecten irradians TaxID=31199 RepID=UPI003720FFD4
MHQTHNKNPKDLKRSGKLRLKSTSSRSNKRVAPVADWVAFHANGHTISFSDLKTNIGNNEYHPTTGIFTCQKAGVCVFSWSIRSHDSNHRLETALVRNGAAVGHSTAGGGDNNPWRFGSATVTLILNPGDEARLVTGKRSCPLCND